MASNPSAKISSTQPQLKSGAMKPSLRFAQLRSATMGSSSTSQQPWTEEELIASGIEERHWPLAHWFSDLQDLKDSLAK